MFLEWLDLSGYRSYDELAFRPDPGVNVLIGDNGSGKTNVLEAIGYLSSLRSFRRSPDAALVATGAEMAVIRGGIQRDAGELSQIRKPSSFTLSRTARIQSAVPMAQQSPFPVITETSST